MIRLLLIIFFTASISGLPAQNNAVVKLVAVDTAWANNSVNVVVFRKNPLITFRDTQYIAYYDNCQYVVLGKRRSGTSKWRLQRTPYKGNAPDAHRSISMMVDGGGYLHIAWDHHDNPLNYCKSLRPGSLELTGRLSMTGSNEQKVTYPEFYKMPGGNILFFYRNGIEWHWYQTHSHIKATDHYLQAGKTFKRRRYFQGCGRQYRHAAATCSGIGMRMGMRRDMPQV